MGANNIHDIRWLRSRPVQGAYAASKVNAELGIIEDVVMVQEGEAKGHDMHLDADFIRDLVAYDQATYGDRGLKARFGHPSASSETMGTQLGVFKNVRARKENGKLQAVGSLHLLEASDESPTHPGMRSWVIKMAQEQPDFIMSSIVFRAGGYYQRKANGHKLYLQSERDANPELGHVFVEFGEKGEHFYTDLVEQGAATDNLFSNQVNPHLFVAQADQFLADNPKLTAFIKANPEKVTAFFASLGISISNPPAKKMAKFDLFKWLSGDSNAEAEDLDEVRTALSDAQKEVTALKASKEAAENRAKELEDAAASTTKSLRDSNEDIKALNAQLASVQEEFEAFKKEAADEHTGGDSGGGDGDKVRAYHKTPIYQKAQERFGKKGE